MRSVTSIVALGTIYAQLPLDRAVDGSAFVLLVAALLVFCLILTLQIRSILRSTSPVLRAVEVLSAVLPLFLLTFAAIYVVVEHAQPGSFTQPLNRPDSVYFTVTVFATVGFGDITPVTTSARMLVTAQMIGDLVVLGVVLKLVVGAAQMSRRRLSAQQQTPFAPPQSGAAQAPDPVGTRSPQGTESGS